MRILTRATAIAVLCISGCTGLGRPQETRYIEPVLPMSLSATELVDHLNRQHPGLHCWRCTDLTATANMPGTPRMRMSGQLACEAPNHFRLKAKNTFAQTDLGANSDRCWFYAQPGEQGILTWKHDDSDLLQHFQVGVPRIDPEWLMNVLCVVPLQGEDYEISPGPAGSKDLWLTAIEEGVDGRSLRRVIKVDSVSGRIREHAIYDSERTPLVRAVISEHRSVSKHLLPTKVRIEFPAMDASLVLSFGRIEANCTLPDTLWSLPHDRNVAVTDLGDVVRRHATRGQPPGDPQNPRTASLPAITEGPHHTQDVDHFDSPNQERSPEIRRISDQKHSSQPDNGGRPAPESSLAAGGMDEISDSEEEIVPEWDAPEASPRRFRWRNPFLFRRRASVQ
jgi:hypothetical protein